MLTEIKSLLVQGKSLECANLIRKFITNPQSPGWSQRSVTAVGVILLNLVASSQPSPKEVDASWTLVQETSKNAGNPGDAEDLELIVAGILLYSSTGNWKRAQSIFDQRILSMTEAECAKITTVPAYRRKYINLLLAYFTRSVVVASKKGADHAKEFIALNDLVTEDEKEVLVYNMELAYKAKWALGSDQASPKKLSSDTKFPKESSERSEKEPSKTTSTSSVRKEMETEPSTTGIREASGSDSTKQKATTMEPVTWRGLLLFISKKRMYVMAFLISCLAISGGLLLKRSGGNNRQSILQKLQNTMKMASAM